LALPPNRGLPGAVLQIDLDGLRAAGTTFRTLVGSIGATNMLGGGTKMTFPCRILPQFIEVMTQ
jgi:hypothetical protein